jgi:N-acetylglutamate synthase
MTAIGRLRISPSDVGRRVSVRYLTEEGLTDVLGQLVSWSGDWPAGIIKIRKKDDSCQDVVSGKIIAAKVVEPEIGCLDLQRDSESTWVPLETESLGDWVLRFSGNESARANSCRLDGRPENSTDESLLKIIDWYKTKKAAAIVQSPKPGAFDEALARNNFVEVAHALYMIADTVESNQAQVIIESELSSKWFDAVMAAETKSPRLSKELLVSGSFVRFASIVDEKNKIIATGRVSASKDLAMVTTVWVDENHRSKGLAKSIMLALSNEVFKIGHKIIALQVLKSNLPAVGLYESLGYQIHHDYAYYRYTKVQQPIEVGCSC